MHRPNRFNVVRDVERALALVAAVVFAFALILGSVAPAASAPETRGQPAAACERDEPGLALPVERPAAGPWCRAAPIVEHVSPATY